MQNGRCHNGHFCSAHNFGRKRLNCERAQAAMPIVGRKWRGQQGSGACGLFSFAAVRRYVLWYVSHALEGGEFIVESGDGT